VALCEGCARLTTRARANRSAFERAFLLLTAPQTEFASDVIFRDQASLDRCSRLILHGILNLGCEQVMRFLGKQLNGGLAARW